MSKKICFISAVNNEKLYNRCLDSISKLNVPEDVDVEIVPVRNSTSITSAYNKGMSLSDAKYKVYIHQDALIINKNFIYDILDVFEKNKDIGMIGSCGAKYFPEDGVWWNSKHTLGRIFCYLNNDNIILLDSYKNIDENNLSYDEVCCIDGFVMITQYDIWWREDIFDAWHFYDASQSMEFINKGYKIVIPKQYDPWYIHKAEANLLTYEEYRLKFLETYASTIKKFEAI